MHGAHLVEGRIVESPDSPPAPDDYVLLDGFRLVKPYHFDFVCNVKQRWEGQDIVDVFCEEFPALSRQYYEAALVEARLRVEDQQGRALPARAPLRTGTRMRHFIHRHEPPVPDTLIQVVGAGEGVVAVRKPAGLPVHVAGQYRKNTVLGVLQAERPDLWPLLPVHRLDKPVSGLLLLARTPAAADALRQQIQGRSVDKVYVARVQGVFPESPDGGPVVANVALIWDAGANSAAAVPGARCEPPPPPPPAAGSGQQAEAEQQAAAEGGEQQPPGAQPRRRRDRASRQAAKAAREPADPAAPRPALTEFRRLAVAPDGRTSVVECRPLTGRTHQIRVHLQYLGHPIANDSQYGGRYCGPLSVRGMAAELGVTWRQPAGCSRASGDSKRPRLQQGSSGGGSPVGPRAGEPQQPDQQVAPEPRASGSDPSDCDAYVRTAAFRAEARFLLPPPLRDPLCKHCPYYAPGDYPLDARPLWLHARTYACKAGSWSYSAEPPPWADPGFVPDPPAEPAAGLEPAA